MLPYWDYMSVKYKLIAIHHSWVYFYFLELLIEFFLQTPCFWSFWFRVYIDFSESWKSKRASNYCCRLLSIKWMNETETKTFWLMWVARTQQNIWETSFTASHKVKNPAPLEIYLKISMYIRKWNLHSRIVFNCSIFRYLIFQSIW